MAAKDPKGYGRVMIRDNGGTELSHRIAWILVNGPVPPETPCVLHACDNPPCCNPAHLFLGTNDDNVADMVAKGRQAHGPTLGSAVSLGRRRHR